MKQYSTFKIIIPQLKRRKSFILMAEGNSMLPILHSNDVVQYKKVNFKQVDINDIVLVRKNKRLFTHRIIYKTDRYLVSKGDSNPESDGKIISKNVLAKVVSVKRNGQTINIEQIYLLQSTFYFQEIVKIKVAFEKENIDFVFLKGLPLHLYFEKTHPKRIYADCDVLINKKDFQKAEKIIKKFGYKKTEANNKQVENNYFKIINGFSVVFDIHLEPAFLMTQFSGLEALYPQKLIDQLIDELLNNKRQITINNQKFSILNTKYLILYLALHLFHHNFRGAFRYQFLDKVIRNNRLSTSDWNKIAQTINNYQLTNFVYPVFVLLKKYYQTPVPDFINFKNFKNFMNSGIFDDEPRFTAGINRFLFIFLLSPRPLWRKLFIFFNPAVVWSIVWAIWKKLSSFFSNRQSVH